MQGGERVLGDGALVHVTPHLEAHQGHADVQSPVELKVEARQGERERCGFRLRAHDPTLCYSHRTLPIKKQMLYSRLKNGAPDKSLSINQCTASHMNKSSFAFVLLYCHPRHVLLQRPLHNIPQPTYGIDHPFIIQSASARRSVNSHQA